MLTEFLQFLLSGITVGATYALVGVGFSIIYNASQVINFAQGEFVMLGGMLSWFLFAQAGLPLPAALPLAIAGTVAVGLALEKFAIEPARNASMLVATLGLPVITMGIVPRRVSVTARSSSMPGTCDMYRSISTMSNGRRLMRSSASWPRPHTVTL